MAYLHYTSAFRIFSSLDAHLFCISTSGMKLTLRHSLARLRMALGNMTQKELADLAGVARTSIQAIELLKLKLSPGLAHKISSATGINYSWLLDGDPAIPPINHAGRPYTEADFALAQDKDLRRLSSYHAHMGRLQLAQAYYFLRRVLEDASKDKDYQRGHFLYRLEHFVRTEVRKRPKLAEQIFAEQQEQWQRLDANVAPGKVYPRGGFLTPADTKACEVMERDSGQNRLTIKRYQKEILANAKRTQVPKQIPSPEPAQAK